MIIDFHTHVFPPELQQRREELLRREPAFAEMYGNPKAKMATAQELLRSMDEAGVEVSVALGFAWRDPELCARHNDYLLEAAAGSGGRIVPFCTVNPAAGEGAAAEVERCARGGARGLGELRPQSQDWPLAQREAADLLAALAARHRLILLFHVTEPVGHSYPGREGTPLADFYHFLCRHPELTVVGAHLAGGLPFFAAMPRVRAALARTYADTAAVPFLYEPSVYRRAAELLGADRLLLGSDFPLISQRRQVDEVRRAGLDEPTQSLILGGNARRLLFPDAEEP